jgi:GDP/UDP-N,N'-diacetylbacillosamine 2-epimerase (hydrolysing)
VRKKKVCIITGSRSEWGLFYPLALLLRGDRSFDLRIIATSAHLSSEFGYTYREIEKDGFKIERKVKTLIPGDTPQAILRSVSAGINGIIGPLEKIEPDLVFLLGDRFETFAAATACLFLKIPIAHIHGGEITEGSLDDSLRHAITKMSYLHFSSTEVYRKRIIRMGEEPGRVFTVGALALDNIKNTRLLDRREFQEATGFEPGSRNIVATFNPPTAEEAYEVRGQIKNFLKAIDNMPDLKVIFTQANPDINSGTVLRLIKPYVCQNRDRTALFVSLGRRLYLSALSMADAVCGNSSSGIIEAPSFGIPTINIGTRQNGRVKPQTVIDCAGSYASIRRAFDKVFSADFRERCRKAENPYGDGHAAARIIKVVREKIYGIGGVKKSFYDLRPS